MQETTEFQDVRNAQGGLSQEFLRAVEAAVDAREPEPVRRLTGELHESDLADLIELMEPDDRVALIELLGADFNIYALSELDATVRDQILEALPNRRVAELVAELDSDDAVYLLQDMDEQDQEEILAALPEADRVTLERGLEYPEESAGRLMQTDFIAIPPFWSVGRTLDFMRETEDLPDDFSELYVIDPAYRLVGRVPLDKLLRSKRPILIEQIMVAETPHVVVGEDQEKVARDFERYNLLSAPVLDENERLVGVITVDDIVDVVQAEAEEDIRRLSGVGDESFQDSVLYITRNRFIWLLVNLATAFLASAVISLFDATIDQMVALAVLMPIVASMGGNAATQTMTVAVRGLATQDLGAANVARVVSKEVLVGLLNGVAFAVIVGVVALLWFGSGLLGGVIAAAMVFNLLAAALAGILIPLALDRYGIDPAVASTVFVTTVTDVVGFFAFLGLAAVVLF